MFVQLCRNPQFRKSIGLQTLHTELTFASDSQNVPSLMRTITAKTFDQPANCEPLAEAQTRAFTATSFREPNFHFHWHYHREVELVWIRQGNGLRYIGRFIEPFRSGDLVLLGPEMPHTWRSAPNPCGNAQWTVVWFAPEHWGDAFWHLPELQRLKSLLCDARRGLHFARPQAASVGTLIEKLPTTPACSLAGFVLLMDILQQLVDMPSRALSAAPQPVGVIRQDPRLQHVLAWLDAHFDEHLRQSEVARRVNMTPDVFTKWFKRHVGRTFQRYLNEIRVANVCARLAHGDENITTAALESGFNNLANFNRRFRTIVGCTPREFRIALR